MKRLTNITASISVALLSAILVNPATPALASNASMLGDPPQDCEELLSQPRPGLDLECSDTGDTDVLPTVSLSWEAPTTRTDGTPLLLSELEGYRVYYGTTSDDLIPLVDINDSTATAYTVTELPAGSYYYAVTAYDVEGLESGFSEIVSKDTSS